MHHDPQMTALPARKITTMCPALQLDLLLWPTTTQSKQVLSVTLRSVPSLKYISFLSSFSKKINPVRRLSPMTLSQAARWFFLPNSTSLPGYILTSVTCLTAVDLCVCAKGKRRKKNERRVVTHSNLLLSLHGSSCFHLNPLMSTENELSLKKRDY